MTAHGDSPVLLTWLYRLLDDREERVRRDKEAYRKTSPVGRGLPAAQC